MGKQRLYRSHDIFLTFGPKTKGFFGWRLYVAVYQQHLFIRQQSPMLELQQQQSSRRARAYENVVVTGRGRWANKRIWQKRRMRISSYNSSFANLISE